jgi:hypothetical protein
MGLVAQDFGLLKEEGSQALMLSQVRSQSHDAKPLGARREVEFKGGICLCVLDCRFCVSLRQGSTKGIGPMADVIFVSPQTLTLLPTGITANI